MVFRQMMIAASPMPFLRGSFLLIVGHWVTLGGAGAVVELPDPPSFLTPEQRVPLKEFEQAMVENEEVHQGYLDHLNEKYIGALESGHARMVRIRAERAATALEGEIARIKAGDTTHSPEIDTAPDFVRQMRAQYEQFLARVNNVKRSRDGDARFVVSGLLKEIEVGLTKADKIDQALELRNYRRVVTRPPKAPAAVPGQVPPEPRDEPGDVPPEPRDEPGDEPRDEPGDEPDPVDEPEGVYLGGADIPRPMTADERTRYASQLGEAPKRTGAGYAPMVDSIRRGDVTEIKLSSIKGWGPARPQLWNGKPVWTATVTYPTKSLFGVFDTEGMAIMLDGRVVEWLYTGSGEEIP